MDEVVSSRENLTKEAKLTGIIGDEVDSIQNSTEEDPELQGLHPCCNPGRAIHRYIFLIFMSFLGFGNYFVYDNPAALEKHFMQDLDLTFTKYSFLYSVYSYPNIILCFFGGFLIDRVLGLRWGAVLFGTFILIGQFVFALGVYLDTWWVVLMGRFIFGLGGENLAVAQNLYGVSWFIGKELNMVLGLQLSFARVGSTVNMNVMGPLYDLTTKQTGIKGHKLLGIVLFYGVFTCILSLLCAIACFIMDKRASKLLKKEAAKTGEVIQLSDVKTFPLTFWFISILCVAYYVAVFPFLSLGPVFLERKWEMSSSMASFTIGLPYIIAAVASPGIGIVIDRTGRNLIWVLVSVIITLGGHGLLAFTFLTPFVGLSFIGIGYSMLACSLWPLVAYVIPAYQLGTAYGIMQSIQNTGLAVVPTLVGLVTDTHGFLQAELLYISMLALALFVVAFLYLSDVNAHGLLNMTSTKRAKLAEKTE